MGLTFLRNPVFERECLAFCRTRKWFFLRTGLVGGLTLAVWLFFGHASGQIRVGSADVVGRTLFAATCLTSVAFVFFVTPALVSDLLSRERRTGNLDVLLATPLSAAGVLLGKFFSRVGLLFVLVAAAFPIIFTTLMFGGVRASQVAGLFLLCIGLVLLLAGPAILFSAFARRAATAAVLAYLLALSPIALSMLAARGLDIAALDWIRSAKDLAFPDTLLARGGSFLSGSLAVFFAGVVVTVLCLLVAWIRLRMERGGPGSNLRIPVRRPRRGRVFDTRNPMVPRETLLIRSSVLKGPFWVFVTLIAGLYAAVLFSGAAADPVARMETHAGLATATAFAILLLATLAGSTSIIADREQGSMDVLRLTRLSPRDVVRGKTLGTFRAVVPLVALPVGALLLAGPFSLQALLGAALYGVELAFLTLLAAMLGVHHSIAARTVTRAILQSLWQFSVLTVAYPLLMVLMGLLMTGKIDVAELYGFTVLYPLNGAAQAAVAGDLGILATFAHIFYLACLMFCTPFLYMFHGRGFSGSAVDSDRSAALSGWEDSWGKLALLWKEER